MSADRATKVEGKKNAEKRKDQTTAEGRQRPQTPAEKRPSELASKRAKSGETATASLSDVRSVELKDIEQRRKEAGIPNSVRSDLKDDLVGLALSGGGIRSSCFNLGVLQALHRTGLIRFVDYLSTVSGGGYVGTHLTSAVHREERGFSKDEFPLKEENDGHKQSRRVQRFVYNGEYLFKPLRLANRYLIGVLLNNVAVFSGMVAASAMIAFLWRCLDFPGFRDRAALLDLSRDLYAPFFPALVLTLSWLIAWATSYWRRATEAPGRWARRLLVVTAISYLIGCALLVGNGDITLGKFGDWFGIEKTVVSPVIWTPIVAVILIALLPFFRPSRLLKSGTRPEHSWERVVFGTSSVALLIGVPLLLIGIIGRENVSGFATHPDRVVHPMEIEDWTLMRAFLGDVYNKESDKALRFDEFEFNPTVTPTEDDSFPDKLEVLRTDTQNADKAYRNMLYAKEGEWKLGEVRYETTRFDDYAERTWAVAGWSTGIANENDVTHYWKTKCTLEKHQAQLCLFLNETVLPSAVLTRHLLVEWDKKKAKQSDTNQAPSQASSQGETKAGTLTNVWIQVLQFFTEAGEIDSDSTGEPEKINVAGIGTLDIGRIRREHDDGSQNPSAIPRHMIAKDNRNLLAVLYPGMIRPTSEIRRRVVIVEDQWYRFKILLVALAIFLGVGLWVDLNATSLHRFYKLRLERAFMRPAEGGKSGDILLSALNTTDYGAPYHLLCSSISLFKKRINEREYETLHGIPVATDETDPRWIDTFVFSRRYCGSGLTDYMETKRYEESIGGESDKLTLSDAMALSGAAFSPTQTRNWLVAFLMLVLNLRLGQWLPNPRCGKPRMRPRFFPLALSLWQRAEKRPYCFVTDGGHSENLGLVELLKRRCRLIIVSDAGQDPEHRFDDLAKAIRKARIHGGVRIAPFASESAMDQVLGTDALDLKKPNKRKSQDGLQSSIESRKLPRCDEHLLIARILYYEDQLDPPDRTTVASEPVAEGVLVYLKPSFTGDEGVDLDAYRRANPQFPHQPTSDQLFNDAQVESYRRLGYHIGLQLYKHLTPPHDDLWGEEIKVEELCKQFRAAERKRLATIEKARQQAVVAGHQPEQDAGAVEVKPGQKG